VTPPLPVFHYTKGFHLTSIGESGVLRPSMGMGVRARPVLWLSTNSEWERTVDCGAWWDGQDEDACPGGYVRISVKREAAPYRWSDYKRLGGEDPVFLKALANTAREVGANVREWRVSFDPVPRDLWLGVQLWLGGNWEDIRLIYDFPEGWWP
jgi:hypothetical protein